MNTSVLNQILETVGPEGHVIWDWNGTLLNDVDHCVATVNSLLDEHGLPMVDRDDYRKVFEFPVIRYYEALGFDFGKETFESLCHRFVERFMAGFRELPLVEGMETTIRELERTGVRQSILSASSQMDLDEMLAHFQLSNTFSHVFGIENKLAASKVDRGLELMRVSNSSSTNTVMIGDTLHDLEVAERMGIQAILVGHGHQCPTRFVERYSR